MGAGTGDGVAGATRGAGTTGGVTGGVGLVVLAAVNTGWLLGAEIGAAEGWAVADGSSVKTAPRLPAAAALAELASRPRDNMETLATRAIPEEAVVRQGWFFFML